MVKINLNFGNKTFYIIIILAVILVVGGFVIAYGENNPPVMGHSLGELDASQCANGQVLKKTSGVWACGDVSSGVSAVSGSSGISVSPTTGNVVVSPDTTILQKRVSGTCTSGAIKSIDSSGNVNCGSAVTCTTVSGRISSGSSVSYSMSAGTIVACDGYSPCTCLPSVTTGTPPVTAYKCSSCSVGGDCQYWGQVCG